MIFLFLFFEELHTVFQSGWYRFTILLAKTAFPVSFSMSLPTLVFPVLFLIFFLMVAILMGVR